MEYRTIEHVDKPISKIVFGCANAMMTSKPKTFQWGEVFHLLDEALEAGINTFDTAENYGESEIVLGKWINKRKVRDKVVIITKGCHPKGYNRVTPEELKKDLKQSFRRLRTDYIDIYMLHRDSSDADIKGLLQVLNKYLKDKKIGAIGVSNWTHERIEEANKIAEQNGLRGFTVSSPNFGPAKQIVSPWGDGCVSISGAENESARRWYEENQIPVLAYSCLGRGMFSGKVKTSDLEHSKAKLDKFAIKGYWCQENIDRLANMEKIAKERNCSVAQVALAWIMQQKFEVFPIVTISNRERIWENIMAIDINLNQREIMQVSE